MNHVPHETLLHQETLIPSAARNLRILSAAALLLTLAATSAHAQGCAQCLDSTATTPPSVQAAYRHAIELMASAAATVFLAATFLLRRHR